VVEPVVVTGARLIDVALPLREPFRISGGSMTVRRSVLVRLEAADGTIGVGESAPFDRPFYSSETVSSVRAILTEVLLPRVIAHPVEGPAELRELLSDGIRGNRMARAGVETAWWDLVARRRRVPLTRLVDERLEALGVDGAGRQRRAAVPCGFALGIPASGEVTDLDDVVHRALERGYRRIKLKVRPGWSAAPTRRVLDLLHRMGRSVPVWVDANGGFDRERDRDELTELAGLDLAFIEQPFAPDAWWDAAEWNRISPTPACLDETLDSDTVARQVVAMDGPTIWNLKVQRLGGLEETCRVYARALRHGVAPWMGTMPETGVGAQAGLAVAGLAGMRHATDLEPSDRWYAPGQDPVTLTMDPAGMMAVPAEPPAGDPTRSFGPGPDSSEDSRIGDVPGP